MYALCSAGPPSPILSWQLSSVFYQLCSTHHNNVCQGFNISCIKLPAIITKIFRWNESRKHLLSQKNKYMTIWVLTDVTKMMKIWYVKLNLTERNGTKNRIYKLIIDIVPKLVKLVAAFFVEPYSNNHGNVWLDSKDRSWISMWNLCTHSFVIVSEVSAASLTVKHTMIQCTLTYTVYKPGHQWKLPYSSWYLCWRPGCSCNIFF